MFASPLLFDRVGWGGVANATPNFMLWAGLPFFAGCIAYTFMAGKRDSMSHCWGWVRPNFASMPGRSRAMRRLFVQ